MSRFRLAVHYDFASTICFVAHRVLGRMSGELDAMAIDLDWRPLDLVAITGWRRGEPVEGPRRDNALRVARELGVAVRMPGAWLDSRRAHAVALGLAGSPKEAAWRERVWSAIFDEGRDVGVPGEIERLAADVAVADAIVAASHDYSRLDVETEAAREAEVSGVPTFHVGFPLGGIQDPETMRLLLERWVARQRRSALA